MSLRVPVASLKPEDIDHFEKHLLVEEETKQTKARKQKFPWMVTPKLNTLRRDGDYVYLPFQWAMMYYGKRYRTTREECAATKISFKGKLREEQRIVMKETIQLLNQDGSCMMAMYPGGGKCLARGTKVLLFNGEWRKVEELEVGSLLAGDESCYEPQRVILSLCRGREMMYRISHASVGGIHYTVNASHILTLWNCHSLCLQDVPILDFLGWNEEKQRKYEGVYSDFNGRYFNLVQERVQCRSRAKPTGEMNKFIYPLYDGDRMDREVRRLMLCGFRIIELRFHYGEILVQDDFGLMDDLTKRVVINYPLRIEAIGEDDYYGFEIDGNRRFLLWNGIITHNTITSLAISSVVGLRTMILVNKLVLMDQWVQSIQKVFGEHTRLQVLTAKNKIQPGCSFYIMNAQNVGKRTSQEFSELRIGFVIVDECHLMMTKMFSKSLNYLYPRYLLGLSATPFRPDGFDSLLMLYFGIRKVVRKLFRAHSVYFLETEIKMEAAKDARGEIIWNSIIDQQTGNEERNNLILRLCRHFGDRNILILSKRISQIDVLCEGLSALGEKVTSMKDSDCSFDKEARILIATYQKVGTGFSHEKLDMLILATDAEEYFIQYLGRVFRTPEVEPVVIDLVDNNPILKRHFLTRKKVYQECGGNISVLKKSDLNGD